MNILFDIDGTLVQSYRLDSVCFVQAVREVLGEVHIHADWHAYRHVTDKGIFAQICAENGVAGDREAEVRARFAHLLGLRLAADPGACREVPGAGAMLAGLAVRAETRIGLATGGWSVTAAARLEQAGIGCEPGWLYSSDISAERTGIMRACLAGVGQAGAPVVYVGDGERDVAATAALGWPFIGIGPRLKGLVPRWIADFEGPGFAGHLADLSDGALVV